MRNRGRGLAILLSLAVAASLPACGDDEEPVEHGLTVSDVASDPQGDPIEVGFDVLDGTTYVAEVAMSTDFWQRSNETGKLETRQASAKAVLEIEQTFLVPGGGRVPHSTLSLRYTSAEGPNVESFVDREPIKGTLRHAASGRADRATLRLEGGTEADRVEALDRIGGLLFAGYAGSPPWLPDRAVRVGEVWPVEGFIRPRGMDNALRHARQLGVSAPEPTLTGTIRVAAVKEVEGARVLELAIDALIELSGVFRQGNLEGRMAYGNRVHGSALVSVATGLPVSFDVTETIRTDTRAGSGRAEQRATSTVSGKIRVK